jgi:hypothetical protein
MDDSTIILLLTPVIVAQLVLMIVNLVNWSKKKKTKHLSKGLWLAIILLGSTAGNIVYLVVEYDRNKD